MMFGRKPAENRLDAELRFHIEEQIASRIAGGMEPVEARRTVMADFGGLEPIKEECRDERKGQWLENIAQDIRYALRVLRRSPGFTAVTVATLALGIGANTSIFSVVNALLLRPLAYADAGRLVRVWATDAGEGSNADVATYPQYAEWRKQSHGFEDVAAFDIRSVNLAGGSRPERVEGIRATAGLLPLLRVSPIAGRGFTEEEEQPGKNHVALVTERLWQNRFGRDPGLIGRPIKLNAEPYMVIGVLPGDFSLPPGEPTEVMIPLPPDPSRNHGFLNVVARLLPRTSIASTQAELNAISSRLQRSYAEEKGRGALVMNLHESFAGPDRLILLVVWTAVSFVLLIACANVANLFVARTAARQKEFTVRSALGAGRMRLIRQMLTESAMVGLAGGGLGLLVAAAGVSGLVRLVKDNFPAVGLDNVSIDGPVLAFTLVIALATGLLSGLAPALSGSRPDLNDALKEGSRGVIGSRKHQRLRAFLVTCEMALALMLLAGAGLAVKSLLQLRGINSGVHTENILAMDFALQGSKFAAAATRSAFFWEVLHRVEALPGVMSAAVVSDIPLSTNTDTLNFSIEGKPDPGPGKRWDANFNIVGPDYFKTLGVPLLRGRDFSEKDTAESEPAAMINQSMAARFWAGADPVGARISTDQKRWYTITGVVADVRQRGPARKSEPEAYLTYTQDPVLWPYLSLLVRVKSDPLRIAPSIQSVVWSVDKDQPVSNIRTMEQVLSRTMAQPRILALLLSIFAGLALLLAAVGVYGVMAYSVTQRTHEMGVRAALGASKADVIGLVAGRALLLVLAGVGAGLVGALALTRLLSSLLYNVRPSDPVTFAAVSLLLGGVAFLAAYIPARRTARVDPMVALRYE
jgi:putative ABC transport system permease protein